MRARSSPRSRRCWATPTRVSPSSTTPATPTTGSRSYTISSRPTRRSDQGRTKKDERRKQCAVLRLSSFVVGRYQEAAMQLDRQTLQQDIHALYRAEHAAMGERGTLERLEQARQWDLSSTVRAGGVLVFPHAGVLDCGHQIAAVVHACLDSGA